MINLCKISYKTKIHKNKIQFIPKTPKLKPNKNKSKIEQNIPIFDLNYTKSEYIKYIIQNKTYTKNNINSKMKIRIL